MSLHSYQYKITHAVTADIEKHKKHTVSGRTGSSQREATSLTAVNRLHAGDVSELMLRRKLERALVVVNAETNSLIRALRGAADKRAYP
jgi:hypothetical protein